MKNIYSDLAGESLLKAVENKDYTKKVDFFETGTIETFEILRESENHPFKKGRYVEITFQQVEDIKKELKQTIQSFIKQTHIQDPLILVVGLGNGSLTSDAIGPRTVSEIHSTSYKDIDTRHLEHLYNIMTLIPGVLYQSGMESSKIIESIVDSFHVDIVICIDALCANSVDKINHVIQFNNVGINPGSGIGNHRLRINASSIKAQVIAIGVPTVIHVSSLLDYAYDTLEGYFKEAMEPKSLLMVSKRKKYQGELSFKQKELLLGEVGILDKQERRELFDHIFKSLENDLILCAKDIDITVEKYAYALSSSINELSL